MRNISHLITCLSKLGTSIHYPIIRELCNDGDSDYFQGESSSAVEDARMAPARDNKVSTTTDENSVLEERQSLLPDNLIPVPVQRNITQVIDDGRKPRPMPLYEEEEVSTFPSSSRNIIDIDSDEDMIDSGFRREIYQDNFSLRVIDSCPPLPSRCRTFRLSDIPVDMNATILCDYLDALKVENRCIEENSQVFFAGYHVWFLAGRVGFLSIS
jgi:hypothetical protein